MSLQSEESSTTIQGEEKLLNSSRESMPQLRYIPRRVLDIFHGEVIQDYDHHGTNLLWRSTRIVDYAHDVNIARWNPT